MHTFTVRLTGVLIEGKKELSEVEEIGGRKRENLRDDSREKGAYTRRQRGGVGLGVGMLAEVQLRNAKYEKE